MRGAVITDFKQPLAVRELPDPTPGTGDVIVQTQACGICRSDWHLWQHDWTWLGIDVSLPRVPGHEFGGVIVEAGRDVKAFRSGDRVTVCPADGVIGVHEDGGYASMVKVPNA